jgi:hypothetical protein
LGEYGLGAKQCYQQWKQNGQRAEYDSFSTGNSHGSFSFDVLYASESVTGEHLEAKSVRDTLLLLQAKSNQETEVVTHV